MKPYRQAGWKNGRPVFVRQAIGRPVNETLLKEIRSDRETGLDINNPNDHAVISFSYGHAPKRADVVRTTPCQAIRDSQEVYCPICALRWSLDEDRPECPQ